jgi:hypothetical protein
MNFPALIGQRSTVNAQRPSPTIIKLLLKLLIISPLHFAASVFSAIFAACEQE